MYLLPDHYAVTESGAPGYIHCKSRIGIEDDMVWDKFFQLIKAHFGKRFVEVNHSTCTNHVDFTIYVKTAFSNVHYGTKAIQP